MKLGRRFWARSLLGVAAVAAAIAGYAAWRLLASERPTGALGSNWVRHEDPAGFSVDHPEGWSVSVDAGTATVSGEAGARVLIRPFFVRGELGDEAAVAVATDLSSSTTPEVAWDEPTAWTPGVVRTTGSGSDRQAVSIVTWAGSSNGTAGQLYVTSSTVGRYAQLEGTFARIVESFEIHGPPVEGSTEPSYETWTDPTEGAFSVEIPQGWLTEGGVVRPSTVLVQGSVEVSSPDGEVFLSVGDAYPFFTEPNDVLAFQGIGEGGTYVSPDGYSSPVQWYAPGADFVTDYVLPERAPGAEITRIEDRSDLASSLVSIGINRYDAGEVEYRFERDGRPYVGGALSITESFEGGVGTAWHVWRVYLFEAPEERYGEALAALVHAAETFEVDPQWAQVQAQITAEQSRIIAQMGSEISETMSQGYWGRQAVLDPLSQRRSDATLEIERLADPVTGDTIEVESGSNYYWVDPGGTIVGTDVHAAPSVDFRELIPAGG